MTPSGDIYIQVNIAIRQQAITWANVDFSLVSFFGIHYSSESNYIMSAQATVM